MDLSGLFWGLYCIGWIVSSCLYLHCGCLGLSGSLKAYPGLPRPAWRVWPYLELICAYLGLPGLSRACVGLSGHVLLCLGLFGLVYMFLGLSGLVWQDVWTFLDLPGLLCTCMCLSGFVRACQGFPGPFCACLSLSGSLFTGLPRPAWLVWA